MTELSTQQESSKKEQKDSESTGNLPVLLTFYLKSGEKTAKTAMIHPGEFDKFSQSILDQITKEGNVWFYFIEYDKPHRSSLIRIEDIVCCEIQEYQELSKEEKNSLIEKYKKQSSISGLI